MKKVPLHGVALVFLLLVLFATPIRPQEEGSQAATPSTTAPLAVQLTPEEGSSDSPLGPIRMVFSLRNLTDETISITEIKLECPRRLLLAGVREQTLTYKGVPFDLRRSPQKISLEVPSIELSSLVASIDWLFFREGTYTFHGEIVYKTTEESLQERVYAEVGMRFVTPIWCLFVGALFGAFFMEALGQAYECWSLHRAGEWNKEKRTFQWRSFWFRLGAGSLTALAAILLATITSDFSTFVSIKLLDIWAGMVVGMLAQSPTGPLAEAVRKYLGHRPA